MENSYITSLSSIAVILVCGVGIYLTVIVLTRIFGKRSFSKMSSFDFAMTVAVGSIIATTLLSSTVSLTEGAFGMLVVYVLQLTAAVLRRFEVVEKAIDNTPLLLMDGPVILHENLRKARVSESDLRAKLREANVMEKKDVKAVIFETTGDIAVLHSINETKKIEPWFLDDVAT